MSENNLQFNQFSQTEQTTPIDLKIEEVSQEKKKSSKKNNELSIKIVENPIRKLPKLINEVLEKDFSVILSKNGYYIEGFYGLNIETNKKGFAFAQETEEEEILIFYDAKGHKHTIKTFEELVNFNSLVWSYFFKMSEQYKKPDQKWFGYMLELGTLNITPNVK